MARAEGRAWGQGAELSCGYSVGWGKAEGRRLDLKDGGADGVRVRGAGPGCGKGWLEPEPGGRAQSG